MSKKKLKKIKRKIHNVIILTLLFCAACGYFLGCSAVYMYGLSIWRVLAITVCMAYVIIFIVANEESLSRVDADDYDDDFWEFMEDEDEIQIY